MTSDGGHRLVGRAVERLEVGAAVVAMIRPEKVVVSVTDESGPDRPNVVPVTCEEVTFTGEMSRYVVGAPHGERFVLRVQNRPGSVPIAIGDQLRLTWDAEDLRIFPADQAVAEEVA
jgi:ABC-type Fe3+/spermidine/putrescine transport system ATPase subunit